MRLLLTILAAFLTMGTAHAANFPYIRLNAKTNRLSDSGTAVAFNGTNLVQSTEAGITNALGRAISGTGPLAATSVTDAKAPIASPTFTGTITTTATNGLYTPFDYTSVAGLMMALRSEDLDQYAVGSMFTNWTGIGISATCTTTTNGPFIATGFSGRRGASFKGTNNLQFTPLAAMNTNSTIFIALECAPNLSTGAKYLLGGASTQLTWDSSNAGSTLAFWYDSTSGTFVTNYWPVRMPLGTVNPTRAIAFTTHKYGDATWPDTLQVGVNDCVLPFSAPRPLMSWPRIGVCTIGTAAFSPVSATYGFVGLISEFVIYTNSLSANDSERIRSHLVNKFGANLNPGYVMMDGDQGFIGGAMGTSEKQFAPVFHQINRTMLPHEGSISASTSRTLADVQAFATNTAGVINSQISPVRRDNLYLLYYGANSYLQTGSGATLWPILSNCMASAKSLGYTVPAIALLPAGGTNDVERVAYNDLLYQNWYKVADAFIDLRGSPSDYTNTTLYLFDGAANGYCPSALHSGLISSNILKTLRKLCTTNLLSR